MNTHNLTDTKELLPEALKPPTSTISNDQQDAVFRALADGTRRQILSHLAHQDMTIGEVTDQFEMTRAAVKKHLIILEEGKLISVHTAGRTRINRLNPSALKVAADWIDYFSQFWDERLSTLKDIIEKQSDRSTS